MPPTRSLDLHGYTREKALQKLTDSIEICQKEGEAQLVVITGVGLHSQKGGAVLRPAVQKYLETRKFYYKYQSGCFEIEVGSGELRYSIKTAPPSTKILHAVSLGEEPSLPLPSRKTKIQRSATLPADLANGPLPREVVHDDKLLGQGKQQSLQDYREYQKILREENEAIARALELSAHEEYSCSEDNDDGLLEDIIERSRADFQLEASDRLKREEDLLQQVIDMSMNDCTESSTTAYRDEDALFQRILEQSVLQAKENDEDELLLRAIEASKAEAFTCCEQFVSQTDEEIGVDSSIR